MSSPPATILPDPEHLQLQRLCSDDGGILATVTAIAPSSRCPSCHHPSRQVHSRYVRHLSDLPWHGIAFRLHVQARRFFCDQADGSQRIFTERLPRVVAPSARMTLRLAQVLHQVAVGVTPVSWTVYFMRHQMSARPDAVSWPSSSDRMAGKSVSGP